MRLHISEAQAKRRIEGILRLAQAGHQITLTRHGRPIAELGPVRSSEPRRQETVSAAPPILPTEGHIAAALSSGDGEQVVEAMRQAMHGSGKPGSDQGPTRKAEVVSIARLAVEVFGSPTEAARWLVQPAMGLNRQRPIDMIGSGGIAEVALFLGRLEYEVYA